MRSPLRLQGPRPSPRTERTGEGSCPFSDSSFEIRTASSVAGPNALAYLLKGQSLSPTHIWSSKCSINFQPISRGAAHVLTEPANRHPPFAEVARLYRDGRADACARNRGYNRHLLHC